MGVFGLDMSVYENELEMRLRRLGYDVGCMEYVKIGFEDGQVVYRRLPNVDDFGGISDRILNIYMRDLMRVLESLNNDRGAGVFVE